MAQNIPLLPEGCLQFPDPHQAIAEHDGLVAVSRDLTAQRLLAAYQQGIFPWFEEDGLFFWFATAPRTVLYPQRLHVGRSLAKTMRNRHYAVTVNQNFHAVISAHAQAASGRQLDRTGVSGSLQRAAPHRPCTFVRMLVSR